MILAVSSNRALAFFRSAARSHVAVAAASSSRARSQIHFSSSSGSSSSSSSSSGVSVPVEFASLAAAIEAKGEEVRALKASGADKAQVKASVDVLLALKADYKSKVGADYGAAATATAAAAAAAKAPSPAPKSAPTPTPAAAAPAVPTVAAPVINYFGLSPDDSSSIAFGDYTSIASQAHSGRVFVDVKTLGTPEGPKEGQVVWLRGRVNTVRAKGNTCFVVVRSGSFYTLQACHFKEKLATGGAGGGGGGETEAEAEARVEQSKGLLKFAASLPLESIVDIQGVVAAADVKACSQNNVEIQIKKIFVVSRAPVVLPFLLEDAARSQADIDASQDTPRPFAGVTQDMRLNNRWLDLRVPANNAIIRIRSGVSLLFREALAGEGFTEIHSPKLIAGESEGGADVFRTDYFGQKATLAQSPQLYKQMAISADLDKVFEIGPVFRAENSNTRRHLCEFTGLDLEMAITEHYEETLHVIHRMFKHIFNGLESRYSKELAIVRQQYPSSPVQFTDKPLIIHWHDAMQMLREAGHEVDPLADLSSAIELTLGQLVLQKHKADFFMLGK